MDTTLIIWIALTVVFIIIEAATVQLTTVWFAIGAAVALVLDLCGLPLWVQIVVFVLVSVLALILSRPLLRRLRKKGATPTNADRNIGREGIVTERIDELAGTGRITISGISWAARSSDGSVIEKDSVVIAERIEGARMFVRPKDSGKDKN